MFNELISLKNEDRQWHEAWKVEAQRAKREEEVGREKIDQLERGRGGEGAVLSKARSLNYRCGIMCFRAYRVAKCTVSPVQSTQRAGKKTTTCQVNFKGHFEGYHCHLI